MVDLSVDLAGIRLKNPVITASGTFGYGEEFAEYIELNKLGAIITKTITYRKREGNPPPRIAEVEGGIVNSVGLENPGVKDFLREKWPQLRKYDVPIIVSIAGESKEEFFQITEELNAIEGIAAIELNLSCPNVRDKKLFAQDEKLSAEIIREIKKLTPLPLIAKLTPQVTDIVSIAKACQRAGADVLSLINTIPALVIDLESREPFLGGITGGLSGPAIRPVALKMVWEVSKVVSLPIIGMGGIMRGTQAIEFILAGATAVGVGTANLVSPNAAVTIIEEIGDYLVKHKLSSVRELVGKLSSD